MFVVARVVNLALEISVYFDHCDQKNQNPLKLLESPYIEISHLYHLKHHDTPTRCRIAGTTENCRVLMLLMYVRYESV